MGVDVSFEGIGDLIDELNLMDGNVDTAINSALTEAMRPVLAEAQGSAAFIDRTGDLRKSLKISSVKKSKRSGKYICVYTKSPYAHLVEFGHSGDTAPAHPFLDPAFEHHKAEAQEIIKGKLKEALGGL